MADAVPTLVMGVVNVTPDSFSDGGLWFDAESAIAHGLELVADGADVLDVGGESTRPGAARVEPDEELRRVVPVVRELAGVRSVVSHNAKHARGVLTRHLLARRRHVPVDADGLAAAASELVGETWAAVELGPAGRGARVLTLVEH